MRATLTKSATGEIKTYIIETQGPMVTITDENGERQSSEFINELPTVMTRNGPVALRSNPTLWAERMAGMNYTHLGLRIDEK